MDYAKLKIKKSIESSRLVFEENIVIKLFDLFHMIVISFGPILFSGLFLYIQITNHNHTYLILAIVSLLFGLFLSYVTLNSYSNIKRLIKIGGINYQENRNLIELVASSNNWNLEYKTENLHIFKPKYHFFDMHGGQEIYILYDKEFLFIRCVTFGAYFFVSPYHFVSNRKIELNILKQLKGIKTLHNNI